MWRVYPKSYTISSLLMVPVTFFVYGEVWARYGFLTMLGVSAALSFVGGIVSVKLMPNQTQYALELVDEITKLEQERRAA